MKKRTKTLNVKVFRRRIGKYQSADALAWVYHVGLGERQPVLLPHSEDAEYLLLGFVVRAGTIAEGEPYAPVAVCKIKKNPACSQIFRNFKYRISYNSTIIITDSVDIT